MAPPSSLAALDGLLEAALMIENATAAAAASVAVHNDKSTLFHLYVLVNGDDYDDVNRNRADYAADLCRFATALRNNDRMEVLHVSETKPFKESDAGDDYFSYHASDHLMGEALGSHPTLTRIILSNGILARKNYINAFVSSLLAHNKNNNNKQTTTTTGLSCLRELDLILSGTKTPDSNFFGNDEGVRAVAKLLRANIPIEKLGLDKWKVSDGCGCNCILEALNGNTHLRRMILYDCYSEQVSLSAVQALGRSNLRSLTCPAALLGFGSKSLEQGMDRIWAEGLRRNASLEVLECFELREDGGKLDREQEWAVASRYVYLLTTFNFTLQRLRLPRHWSDNQLMQAQIDQLLLLNTSVRKTHIHLQRHSYHVNPSTIWPLTLDKISSKPSLVYRFLRHGNLIAFNDLVVQGSSRSINIRKNNSGGGCDFIVREDQPPPFKVRRTHK